MELVVSLAVVLSVQVPALQGLQIYSTTGTHYHVGLDVGQHFQRVIQEYYSMMTDLHTKLLPFVETPGGAHVYDVYLKMATQHFPQYVDELRGISDGAKLPFKQVFTNHIWDELSTLIGVKHKKSCTDVYVNDYGRGELVQIGIGHNEDGSPDAKTRAYILNVTIVNNVTWEVEEEFISFTYPGELSGDAYGFNAHGVILTMNAVFPVPVGIGTVPRDFILRATFAVRNQAELETLMLCQGTGVGYGYNLNYANNRESRVLVSYEVAPMDDQSLHALVSKYTVGLETNPRPQTNATGRYFHFNLYNHTVVHQIESDLKSSYHRKARVAQLPTVRAFSDLNVILGDTYDESYPIYRTPRPTDETSTLSTALFDLTFCNLYIYTDNPKSSRPLLNLTLPWGKFCKEHI